MRFCQHNVSWRTVSAGAQHAGNEYGVCMDAMGRHRGGPFRMDVAPKMRVQDVRRAIMVRGCTRVAKLGSSMQGMRWAAAGADALPAAA